MKLLSCVSSKSFIGLGFTFKALMHFALIFLIWC